MITRTTCRVCRSRLYSVLDFGEVVPSDFVRPDAPDPRAIPLHLMICEGCGLVQLQHTVDPESLYRRYWYVSGTNETMCAELADIVAQIRGTVDLSATDAVIDIGANDGTLLANYHLPQAACPVRIAYEPAYNLFERLRPNAEIVIPDFFPPTVGGRATKSIRAISSVAMFYDLDDPLAFVKEVDRVLTPDGVWIVQFQDLAQMVQTGAFDNCVAEHLCYYSLTSFMELLAGVDLAVAKVERRAINGGSLRITVRRGYYQTDLASVQVALDQEAAWITPQAMEKFAWRAEQFKTQFLGILNAARHVGPVDLYGASTKSSTLLQYCGVDHKQIRQAAERTPEKVGLVTSGTRIPIVSEQTWRADPAPNTVAVIWQFRDNILIREAEYLANGGHFIFPLPYLDVVYGQQVERATGVND